LSGPALAQQKTVKACQEEWRSNKVANQAAGVTEKAYVDKCRAGGAATQPSVAPPAATTTAPLAPSPAAPAQKTAKACQAEWRANRTAYQSGGIPARVPTTSGAAPASAPPAGPAPAPGASPAARPAPTVAAAPTGANQFAAEAMAKARCPSDTVVWANLNSKIYHFSGHKDYGNTKDGAYMCEKDAAAQGVRAAKNEKHP
jgi:hypothetical protein